MVVHPGKTHRYEVRGTEYATTTQTAVILTGTINLRRASWGLYERLERSGQSHS